MKRVVNLIILTLFLFSILTRVQPGLADGGNTPNSNGRKANLVVNFTQYEWWLLRWSNNEILCHILIDHDGLPSGSEILGNCGAAIYAQWKSTPSCSQLNQDASATTDCTGLYLFLASTQAAEKTIEVVLPPSSISITLANCTPSIPDNLCPELPTLLLTGEEPLPNERVVAIHALLNKQPFNCDQATCEIPLQPTTMDGMTLEFWADSSFGDSSPKFTAQVRVIDSGVSSNPGGSGWYVDVLSSQWKGGPIASCAQSWQAFPPIGGPPAWLSTPEVTELLASQESYYYLAGRLISQKVVDASSCPNGGVLGNGYADACGLSKALPQVQNWQNQFDTRILEVAQKTGVPGQLMKNLFAQESQFWPGAFKDPFEYGLGQLTERGAEVLLLWNTSFFDQFCPLILNENVCGLGYAHIDQKQQALLRGALALKAKTDCTDCDAGIDLTNANFSIELFAQTLLGNCEQVGQIAYNASGGKMAGKISSYEDLWRFTLVNYHAGPGCLSYAMYSTKANNLPMDWEHVSSFFTPACKGVIDYVQKITK